MGFLLRQGLIAEFRGPGVRRNAEDSGDDYYDLNDDQRGQGVGGRSGRIILLGDGTEVLTDSDETEMFDHEEEDKDLDSQVARGQSTAETGRATREETPGPEAPESITGNQIPNSTGQSSSDLSIPKATETPDSTKITSSKVIPESALPDKIVTAPSTQEKE